MSLTVFRGAESDDDLYLQLAEYTYRKKKAMQHTAYSEMTLINCVYNFYERLEDRTIIEITWVSKQSYDLPVYIYIFLSVI